MSDCKCNLLMVYLKSTPSCDFNVMSYFILSIHSKHFTDKLICSSFTCFRMCPVGIFWNRYDNDGILITDFFIIQYIVEILVCQRHSSHRIT